MNAYQVRNTRTGRYYPHQFHGDFTALGIATVLTDQTGDPWIVETVADTREHQPAYDERDQT